MLWPHVYPDNLVSLQGLTSLNDQWCGAIKLPLCPILIFVYVGVPIKLTNVVKLWLWCLFHKIQTERQHMAMQNLSSVTIVLVKILSQLRGTPVWGNMKWRLPALLLNLHQTKIKNIDLSPEVTFTGNLKFRTNYRQLEFGQFCKFLETWRFSQVPWLHIRPFSNLYACTYATNNTNFQVYSKSFIWEKLLQKYFDESNTYTINPRYKPQGLISFMVHNHPGSNRDYKIESINLDG